LSYPTTNVGLAAVSDTSTNRREGASDEVGPQNGARRIQALGFNRDPSGGKPLSIRSAAKAGDIVQQREAQKG
jgi:hypothetical protein